MGAFGVWGYYLQCMWFEEDTPGRELSEIMNLFINLYIIIRVRHGLLTRMGFAWNYLLTSLRLGLVVIFLDKN